MSECTDLTWSQVRDRAHRVANGIMEFGESASLYGVPRGGLFAAQAVAQWVVDATLVEHPETATHIIDDIIDSGATRDRYKHHGKPFLALVDKNKDYPDQWVTFPWERQTAEMPAEENVRRLIEVIGDDPTREGLIDTPKRVVAALQELTKGQRTGPDRVHDLLSTTFEGPNDMVIVEDIDVVSMCEHHMLPFTGKAIVAYVPIKRVLGLSKIPRLVQHFASRLQIQERLTRQIVEALSSSELDPAGVACIVRATHSCMALRGARCQGTMITSAVSGVFQKPEVRAEFNSLIGQ